jgi:hypothetical protein
MIYFNFDYLYFSPFEAFSLSSIFVKIESLRLLNWTGVLARSEEKIGDDIIGD